MTTKLYDPAFDIPISQEQLASIRKRYEYLRKTELYRGKRTRTSFQLDDALDALTRMTRTLTHVTSHQFSLEFKIGFPRSPESDGEARWREYGNTLIRLFGAFARKDIPLPIEVALYSTDTLLGYKIKSKLRLQPGSVDHQTDPGAKNPFLEEACQLVRLFFLPDSTRYAEEPITIGLQNTMGQSVQGDSLELRKGSSYDFISLNDIPLVFAYYQQIADVLIRELAGKGLTVYCAVDRADGESIIRRNTVNGNRLVVDDVDEIGQVIMDYDAYRFVPDVNKHNSKTIGNTPIDFDRPYAIDWKTFSEFVNGFQTWLKEQGFSPKLRLTGGRGAQIILDIVMDRVAKNYSTPFPRPLKFDTWIRRGGEASLISAQATDLVKTLALAYGSYRKHRQGLHSPLTVEVHDLSQRYWNILADSSRAAIDTGVVGLGSIHHKTGAICTPVTSIPPSFTLESTIAMSHYGQVEPVDFQPRFKSLWIQTIGANPSLLYEPCGSNPFSLVEETFEKHGWIPSQYVRLTPERFMEKYCWMS